MKDDERLGRYFCDLCGCRWTEEADNRLIGLKTGAGPGELKAARIHDTDKHICIYCAESLAAMARPADAASGEGEA